ncbi:MAG: hypothetical protein NVS1B13_13220 [Flavisolibacter sp.]
MINKHTILYAEDDLDDLFFVKEAFGKHDNITFLHAPNGYEALKLLESLQREERFPCLIILDINMPVMDGWETLERIKGQHKLKTIPVVLFSTSSSGKDRIFAHSLGAELITKPLKFNDLETIAQQFVEKCNFDLKVKTN